MILVKKVFIFSKTMIICLLCPLLCGLFFFWKWAKGELSYKSTEKRLKAHLYLSLLVYTVVGYGLTLILDYIFSKFDIGIFAWLYWRLYLLFILYLMLGFICIFNYYWKKPWACPTWWSLAGRPASWAAARWPRGSLRLRAGGRSLPRRMPDGRCRRRPKRG